MTAKKILGADEIEGLKRDLQLGRQRLELTKGEVNESLPVVVQIDGRAIVMQCDEARRIGFYVSAARTPVSIPGVGVRLCSIAGRH